MADDPFDRSHNPRIGEVEVLAPGLRVVTAPNAGPMTFTGTRTYLLGGEELAVIDPGPDDPVHLDSLVAGIGGDRVSAVLVTHAHLDHSAGARRFAECVGAPVIAFGRAEPREQTSGSLGGGEGIDRAFQADQGLADGETISGRGWSLTALHTPGHLDDHLCFAWNEGGAVFSGDLVMGWATTMISPPDGSLADFRRSVERLLQREEGVFYPGHGAPVHDPKGVMTYLLAHRQEREEQILAALATGSAAIPELVKRIYADVDPRLHGAAGRNVLAHLIDLGERDLVRSDGPTGSDAVYSLSGAPA